MHVEILGAVKKNATDFRAMMLELICAGISCADVLIKMRFLQFVQHCDLIATALAKLITLPRQTTG